jgi:hypothetical protein
LILSLPKRQYQTIQVKLPDPDSRIKIPTKEGASMKINNKSKKVDSLFGTILIKK